MSPSAPSPSFLGLLWPLLHDHRPLHLHPEYHQYGLRAQSSSATGSITSHLALRYNCITSFFAYINYCWLKVCEGKEGCFCVLTFYHFLFSILFSSFIRHLEFLKSVLFSLYWNYFLSSRVCPFLFGFEYEQPRTPRPCRFIIFWGVPFFNRLIVIIIVSIGFGIG